MAIFVEALPGDQFTVEGGRPVQGAIRPAGNKNEALPVIAASLLVAGPVVLENLPRIGDVETLLEAVRRLGADIARVGDGAVRIDASGLASSAPDPALASRIRGSFLLAAPLLARRGEAVLPRPGGDQIGRRRIDTHVLALRQLGAEIELQDDAYRLILPGRFKGAEVFLDEASVTATENAVMAAVLARGKTRLLNAACEPHVQGLCHAGRDGDAPAGQTQDDGIGQAQLAQPFTQQPTGLVPVGEDLPARARSRPHPVTVTRGVRCQAGALVPTRTHPHPPAAATMSSWRPGHRYSGGTGVDPAITGEPPEETAAGPD